VSEEQHLALPHLYGAPAYSRPPRAVELVVRPFDPDELPIEADRTDDDALLLAELTGNIWTPPPTARPKPRKRLHVGRSSRESSVEEAVAVAVAATQPGPEGPIAEPGLEGRPFRLRSLGRIFGSDQK